MADEFYGVEIIERFEAVAPLAGAWIETTASSQSTAGPAVAPLAGAWIETLSCP